MTSALVPLLSVITALGIMILLKNGSECKRIDLACSEDPVPQKFCNDRRLETDFDSCSSNTDKRGLPSNNILIV